MASNFTKNVISAIDIKNVKYNIRPIPFHATEAEWNDINYIPKQGEFIVYDIDSNNVSPRFKTGDGVTDVKNLPFTLATISEVQAYVNSQIGSAGHLKRIILEDGAELPDVSQADVDTIYMKRNNESRLISDVFDEYMVINGAWEIIGNTRVDLSNYTTQEMVDEKIEDAISNIDFPNEIYINNEMPDSPEENTLWLDTDEKAPASGGGATSWNDLTDKPFGEGKTVLFPETTLSHNQVLGAWDVPGFVPVMGETYIVTYNGVTYESTTVEVPDDSVTVPYICVGNAGGFKEGYPDTGEPFCILHLAPLSATGCVPLDESASVTLKIEGEVVQKLDPKYLPEGVGYTEKAVLFPETTVETNADMDGAMILAGFAPEVGNTYEVKWNGTIYICTASITTQDGMSAVTIGNAAAFGGTDSGEPFFIAYSETETAGVAMVMPLDGSTTATVEIKGEIVRKIPAKFLPATGGGGGVYIIRNLTGLSFTGGSKEVTEVSYDDFAEHWYNGGLLALEHVVEDIGALMYLYPTDVFFIPGQELSLSFNVSGTTNQLHFTNGTWTPPTT